MGRFAVALVVGLLLSWPGAPLRGVSPQPAESDPRVVTRSQGTIPVVREHRYRMAARVRPLLLFWIGKDNVGGARVRWRAGEGSARGFDLLIGSDPARAPRRINRWGFILEESRGASSSVLGVMKRSDEDSLDAAKAGTADEGKQGYFWKMIRGDSDGAESRATVTLTRADRDFSYRELDPLLDLLGRSPDPPRVRTTAVPAGGRAGFLTAVADLVHDAVESVRRDGRAPGPKSLPYAWYGRHYDLRRVGSRLVENATYGETTYPRLVRTDFEVRARGQSWVESFTLVLALDGPLAEVPVFVSYQPKWWFKADMVLDDRERF